MATTRTGHTGGTRPPGGHPWEIVRAILLRDRNLVAAIRTEANQRKMTMEAFVAESLGVKLARPTRPRNRLKTPTP